MSKLRDEAEKVVASKKTATYIMFAGDKDTMAITQAKRVLILLDALEYIARNPYAEPGYSPADKAQEAIKQAEEV